MKRTARLSESGWNRTKNGKMRKFVTYHRCEDGISSRGAGEWGMAAEAEVERQRRRRSGSGDEWIEAEDEGVEFSLSPAFLRYEKRRRPKQPKK
jgi:hypothetical protein